MGTLIKKITPDSSYLGLKSVETEISSSGLPKKHVRIAISQKGLVNFFFFVYAHRIKAFFSPVHAQVSLFMGTFFSPILDCVQRVNKWCNCWYCHNNHQGHCCWAPGPWQWPMWPPMTRYDQITQSSYKHLGYNYWTLCPQHWSMWPGVNTCDQFISIALITIREKWKRYLAISRP